jgi:predicted dehydrogenase
MTAPFRIGLLGASKIAPTAIITPVRDNPDFVVTAVAARDPARARAYAAEHGIPGVAETYADLIAREDIDVVYNGLPPAAHAEWSIAALAAGKAVLCEKPFSRDAAEARAMTEAAVKHGRHLLEAGHYRFHNVILSARRIVESGELGPLRRASAEFNVPIARTDTELRWSATQAGGALMDLGFYPLHALRTLLGAEPVVLSAVCDVVDGIDASTHAEVLFDGVPATIDCSMTAERFSARLVIEGETGALEIRNFVAPQMGCRFTTTTIGGQTVTHPTDGPSTYAAQLVHLSDVLNGRLEPLVGGADAVANMVVIDSIYRAGGKPAFPRQARP